MKPYWLEKWSSPHTVNGAVIKFSEASIAGGINESGLKQDKAMWEKSHRETFVC